MTGWRLGYVAGPREIIQQMITLQQYTFSSVSSFAQKAAVKALDYNVDDYIEQYKKKRDLIYEGLKEKYRVQKPGGAFYIFPEVPGGDGEAFVEKAIQAEPLCHTRQCLFQEEYPYPDLLCGLGRDASKGN